MSKIYISGLTGIPQSLGTVRTAFGTTLTVKTELDARCGNGALQLPTVTEAQKPSNPTPGRIVWNTDFGRAEVFDGSIWRPLTVTSNISQGMEATGGNFVYDFDGWRIHMFTAAGTLNVTRAGYAELLMVGGGGGGGGRSGGGGGGGGVIYYGSELPRIGTSYHFPVTGNHTIGVGFVGQGGAGTGTNGLNGGDTTITGPAGFTNLTARGGGGGGSDGNGVGADGGSGGGGRYGLNGGNATQPGSTWGGFGQPGGFGTSDTWNGGGGGGALTPGERGWGSYTGAPSNTGESGGCGDGGVGLQYKITGANKYYAGGGGGGSHDPAMTGGFGGPGGGGKGGTPGGANGGIGGVDNTGGGGGGGSTSSGNGGGGGAGGTGVVVIRYRI